MLSIGGPLQENDKNKAHDFSEERDELADALEKIFIRFVRVLSHTKMVLCPQDH